MRYLKSLLIMAAASALAFSCKKADTPETVKPEAPVIENASLKGLNGESVVVVGSKVKFSADLSVKGSELSVFSLEISRGADVLASAEFTLKGASATVTKEFDLPISATQLDAPFFPDVRMKAVNTDEMFTERKLSEEENVKITTPELFDALYLVDNNGKCWQMSQTSVKGNYRTDGDLSGIGSSFTIATKVDSEGKVDASGKTWRFDTPDSGEYGLKWIGFDQFTEEICKMIDNTLIVDFSKMATSGEHYVYWSFPLVQDSRVVFLNYPDGTLLQSDRFADVEKNTARYTGHTGNLFEVYYIVDTKWLIVKEQYTCKDALWVTGQNASLPMSPYCDKHPLCWFEGGASESFDAVSCIKTGEGKFKALLYLKENFALKAYSERAWGSELDWTSTTPETLIITERKADPETGKIDGNYGNAGASFTEGLYMLNYDKTTKEVSLEKYLGTVLAGMENGNADPDPSPVIPKPEPQPDPQPETGDVVTLDKTGMEENGENILVRWVLELQQNCTVKFENFDAPIAEMVNLAIFDSIDETAKTARYIGVNEKFEVYYRTDYKWLIFTDNICAENVLLIGKNASFPQKPYTEYPIIETDIPRTPGQTLPLNKVADGIFRSYIYLADAFTFQVYTAYAWGSLVKDWTSGSPALLTPMDDWGYYGKGGSDFKAGIYLVEYDKTGNKVTLTAK